MTTAMHLVPGWHDLVVDTHKDGGPAGASLSVTFDSGPVMVGESFAADHVRPVIGSGRG